MGHNDMFSFVMDYISIRSAGYKSTTNSKHTAPTPHCWVGVENSLPQATRGGTNRGAQLTYFTDVDEGE